MSESIASPAYPVLRFIARRSQQIAAVLAVGFLALAVLAVLQDAPLWIGIALGGGAVVAYFLVRSYGELVSILLDILLPQ